MKYPSKYEKNKNVWPLHSTLSLRFKEPYVFLSGTVYPSNIPKYSKSDQCFCNDKHLGPQGACYPVALCGECDINKSGLCPQENQNLTIPGV